MNCHERSHFLFPSWLFLAFAMALILENITARIIFWHSNVIASNGKVCGAACFLVHLGTWQVMLITGGTCCCSSPPTTPHFPMCFSTLCRFLDVQVSILSSSLIMYGLVIMPFLLTPPRPYHTFCVASFPSGQYVCSPVVGNGDTSGGYIPTTLQFLSIFQEVSAAEFRSVVLCKLTWRK